MSDSILSLMRLLPLLTLLAMLSPVSAESKLKLVPQPIKSTVGDSVTCLAPEFKVTFDKKAPKDLKDAADRMMKSLGASKMRYLSTSYGAEFFPNGAKKCDNQINELHVTVDDANTIAAHAVKPVETRQGAEGYTLNVPVKGRADIKSGTALGAFRGLTSFENLFYKISQDGDVSLTDAGVQNCNIHTRGNRHQNDQTYAPFAPYSVEDKPTFPWRSVLLDTSRNYFTKSKLFQILDGMAKVKLNVFHWHIVDSQSWPLDLKAFPEIAAKAAYQTRKYSEADVKEVIAYAAARGIDVVIEIDTPGHTDSIWHSHPEYVACHEADWTIFANEPPAGQLRFADPAVTDFTNKLFEATMGLTQSSYFSTGGDEINLKCYANDTDTQASLSSRNITLETALRDFTNATHQTLLDHKRQPVVWQEMVLSHGALDVHPSAVVDVWISSADVRAVADKGYRLVHASSDYFYLDCGHGGWVGKDGGLNSWCDPFKSWQLMYSFNPYANLTEAQYPLVLGGQNSLWVEQTDEQNVDTVLFPRIAATAELWWTGSANTVNGSYPRSSVDAFPRMHDIRFRFVDSGLNAVPLQPEWCALRPGACDLSAATN